MNKRRIITGLLTIFVTAGLIGVGTSAFFSDTETSTGNVFQAGAIDLKIDSVQHYNGMTCAEHTDGGYMWVPVGNWTPDNDSHAVTSMTTQQIADYNANAANLAQYPKAGVECDGSWRLANLDDETISGRFFNFLDIKPGDNGENTISMHVIDNDAWMCAALGNLGPQPPTAADTAFQSSMQFFAWWDDGDNIYNGEDVALMQNPLSGSQLVDGKLAIADASTAGGPIPGLTTRYVAVAWCAGTMQQPILGQSIVCDGAGMTNPAQGGSMTADIQFHAVQSRNNATFTCANNWNPVWPEQKVGALLSSYVAPTSCDATINPGGSIQAAIDSATPGKTICLENGNHNGDSYPLRLNKDNLTLAGKNAPTTTAVLNGGVIIDNDGVTVTGLHIGQSTDLGETFGVYVNTDVNNAKVSFNKIIGTSTAVGRGIVNATATTSNSVYQHNVINTWLTGIFLNPSSSMVAEYNTITGNGVGMGNDNPNGNTIRYNLIKNNTLEGIGVFLGLGESINIHSNNIYGNPLGNDLVSYGSETVIAQNNWWGDLDPSDNVTGLVDFMPFAVSSYPEN